MIIELKNDKLVCSVSSIGAEVVSMKNLNGLEFMHQSDHEWNRTSPNLFPFVGCLTESRYTYKGVEYPNLRHGFLRDYPFEVEQVSATKVVCTLRSNEELLKLYPFDFELQITHELIDETLKTSFKVVNLGEEMYFGLGTHASFLTTHNNTTLSDYKLVFEEDEDDYQLKTVDGLVTGEKGYHLVGKELPLNKDLFTVDSMLFANIKSNKVYLVSDKTNVKIAMEFASMPYLCVWSPINCESFVCIEPWLSMVGKQGASVAIEDREDLIYLKAHEAYELSFSTSYYCEN